MIMLHILRVQFWKASMLQVPVFSVQQFQQKVKAKEPVCWLHSSRKKQLKGLRRERTLFISTKSMPISASGNKLQTGLGTNQIFTMLSFNKLFWEQLIGNVLMLVHLMALLYTVEHQQISQLTKHHYITS